MFISSSGDFYAAIHRQVLGTSRVEFTSLESLATAYQVQCHGHIFLALLENHDVGHYSLKILTIILDP